MSKTKTSKASRLQSKITFMAAELEGIGVLVAQNLDAAQSAIRLEQEVKELKQQRDCLLRKIDRLESHIKNGGFKSRIVQTVSNWYRYTQST